MSDNAEPGIEAIKKIAGDQLEVLVEAAMELGELVALLREDSLEKMNEMFDRIEKLSLDDAKTLLATAVFMLINDPKL